MTGRLNGNRRVTPRVTHWEVQFVCRELRATKQSSNVQFRNLYQPLRGLWYILLKNQLDTLVQKNADDTERSSQVPAIENTGFWRHRSSPMNGSD